MVAMQCLSTENTFRRNSALPPADGSFREVNGSCPDCWRWDVEQWGEPVAEWRLRRLASVARDLGHQRVDLVAESADSGRRYSSVRTVGR